jgi:hypothetical protein
VGEAKDIRDKAHAVAAYARMAKNKDLEVMPLRFDREERLRMLE